MMGNSMAVPRHRQKTPILMPPTFGRVAEGAGGRGQRPGRGVRGAFVGAAAGAVALLAVAGGLRAATTEFVVADRRTGLAISGYDPVAYFFAGGATLGTGDLEHGFAGVVWRFRNEGNLGAFRAAPAAYMPRFGGYDPVRMGGGVAVPGDPRLWLVIGGRLYLFYTPQARESFVQDAEGLAMTADQKWPSVRLTLAP
jgi:hypothetical protein